MELCGVCKETIITAKSEGFTKAYENACASQKLKATVTRNVTEVSD